MPKITYVTREIEPRLKAMIRQFPSVAVTGPRQSGKSTLLKKLFAKTHHFVSFDEPLSRQRAISDPKLFIESIRQPAVFDEIQYIPQIISYLKILIDQNRSRKGRFILTGSQQFNLIKGLGDSLAGRIGLLTLLPFSRSEKLSIPATGKPAASSTSVFANACLRGSYPEISVSPGLDFEAWYGSYLQTYLERDVRTLNNIGNLNEFQKFLQLLAVRCSQMLNLNSMAQELGIAVNTIKKWVSVLEASQIIYLLSPYYRNLGKRITKNPKVYFLDCGLVCYLAGIRDKKNLLNGPMAGAIFENYVIQETVKAFMNMGRLPNMFYLRTHNNMEIDLLLERNRELFPYEIKLTRSPGIGMGGPIDRFRQVFTGFDIKQGTILCLADESFPLTKDLAVQTIDAFLDSLKRKIS